MPYLNDITVRIHSQSHYLEEFRIRQHSAKNFASAFIESSPDKEVAISVQAKFPWPYTDGLTSPTLGSASSADGHDSSGTREYNGNRSKQTTLNLPGNEDYILIAEVYLDGCKKAERRAVIYLDPTDEKFPRDGVTWIRHRWARNANGVLQEYHWVFKERGIDYAVRNMDLNVDDAAAEDAFDRPEDALTEAFPRLLSDEQETIPTPQLGQIRVVLRRATIGETFIDPNSFQGRATQGDESLEKKFLDKNFEHVTAAEATGLAVIKPIPMVNVSFIDPEDKPLVEFALLYRSKAQLVKLGLIEQQISPARRPRHLNNAIMGLTPLSFQSEQRLKPEKRTPEAFETRVRKRAIEPYDKEAIIASQGPYRTTPKAQKREALVKDGVKTTSEESKIGGLCRSLRLQDMNNQSTMTSPSAITSKLVDTERTIIDLTKFDKVEFRSEDAHLEEDEAVDESPAIHEDDGKEDGSYAKNPEEDEELNKNMRERVKRLKLEVQKRASPNVKKE